MSKINSTYDIAANGSSKLPFLQLINCLKCAVFVAFSIMIATAVAVIQSGGTFSLMAQVESAGDKSLNNSNINLSSSMSQTGEPGDLEPANNSGTNENQTSAPSLPIITQVSDKGTYKVELRWSSPVDIQSPAILSKDGIDMELLFLNASSPEPTPQTMQDNNLTMDFERSISSEISNLSTVEPIVPVDSFDVTIYDNEGNELWSKVDQTLTAGRASMRVMLDPSYSGGITITVDDIKSPLTADPEKADESVRFTATVQGEQS